MSKQSCIKQAALYYNVSVKMHLATFINVFLLYIVNVIFMIAGIFLNSVVIISLWRSSQLRNKLCYFMIFLLSCFDLCAVIVNHPLVIAMASVVAFGEYDQLFQNVIECMFLLAAGFATFALLTLNIERFLALTYPFFHERMVSKERVVYFLTLLQFSWFVLTASTFDGIILPKHIVVIVILVFFVSSFIYLNYRAFIVARSKRRDMKMAPTMNVHELKRIKFNLKTMSTCFLAVVCFSACSFPQIVFSLYILASKTSQRQENGHPFYLWAATMFYANSTLNCLIFFWRNTVLRREGMKIVRNMQSRCCCLRVARLRNA